MSEPVVIHSDIAALRYCNPGARAFFERNGLSWATFIRDGLPISQIELIDDEMARQAVLRAKQRLGIEVIA